MSLKESFPTRIPDDTQAVGEAVVKADNLYRFVGDHIHEIVDESAMQAWYSHEGRPGVNPLLLLLVTLFQFVEKLPDRQAAEMAVTRLDWKYALRQGLTWLGFNYSDLCYFRQRLLAVGAEQMMFEHLLTYLREEGYIKRSGKQRSDATHVLGQVAWLSRLELMWETLRLAVEAVLSHNARWGLDHLPPSFVESHSQRRYDYRLSAEQVKTEMQRVGEEAQWLLKQVPSLASDGWQELEAMQVLQRVVQEQFEVASNGQVQARVNADCTGDVLVSPHETEVRYGSKGEREWQGYKLQVTETLGTSHQPGFITDVTVTSPLESDQQALAGIQQRLSQRQVTPQRQYVDRGYMSGLNLLESQQRGIDLRGFPLADTSHHPPAFQVSAFRVDIQQQRAVCPAGRVSQHWKTYDPPRKGVGYEVRFGSQCRSCPFFHAQACTTQPRGRTLYLNPQHERLQARRREAQTPAFQREMRQRQGIEATLSEAVRGHGARRARYRGRAKVSLQMHFTASGVNLKRLVRHLAQKSRPTQSCLRSFSRRPVLARLTSARFFNRHTQVVPYR